MCPQKRASNILGRIKAEGAITQMGKSTGKATVGEILDKSICAKNLTR